MSEVVNLNRARKAKARQHSKQQAAENRIKFGQSKTERTLVEKEQTQSRQLLDGAKRED
jgi:hypothetical protein